MPRLQVAQPRFLCRYRIHPRTSAFIRWRRDQPRSAANACGAGLTANPWRAIRRPSPPSSPHLPRTRSRRECASDTGASDSGTALVFMRVYGSQHDRCVCTAPVVATELRTRYGRGCSGRRCCGSAFGPLSCGARVVGSAVRRPRRRPGRRRQRRGRDRNRRERIVLAHGIHSSTRRHKRLPRRRRPGRCRCTHAEAQGSHADLAGSER